MTGIVLTTDLSVESQRAFAPVRELAERMQLGITLVAVLEDIPFEPIAGSMMAIYPDHEQLRQDWQKQLEVLAATLGPACKEAVVLDAADVPHAIVTYAQEHQADYIVMATHGRAGLRRLLLGSVAELVVRHSTMPVLLYPPAK